MEIKLGLLYKCVLQALSPLVRAHIDQSRNSCPVESEHFANLLGSRLSNVTLPTSGSRGRRRSKQSFRDHTTRMSNIEHCKLTKRE